MDPEVSAALQAFLSTAAPDLPCLIYRVLLAASTVRGDSPPAVSPNEVNHVLGSMPQLDPVLISSSGALAAYAAMIEAMLSLAAYARSAPYVSSSSSSQSDTSSSSNSKVI